MANCYIPLLCGLHLRMFTSADAESNARAEYHTHAHTNSVYYTDANCNPDVGQSSSDASATDTILDGSEVNAGAKPPENWERRPASGSDTKASS